ncbi:ArsR family transcriptional regulator [Nocardia sp. NBC_01009]|nr:ArsR family transcriptional regulator [Nocardia sp. NBC_01009]
MIRTSLQGERSHWEQFGRYTVGQIAAEFGVIRPTIYRHLNKTTP